DDELKRFYTFLLKSEARHFQDYLNLARLYSPIDISERVAFFKEKEAELILSPDNQIRFHSGVPSQKKSTH
ncbi:MAG TPA: tRNA isopentenyl-2-thiomethyl-A-37 hydroxylase MiaE, partial [Agitococcus sp.]|nr:tRNA isopentenyl-2-thiomethyl-A-37 hydroxylase MiaE [Agitococcus sp.]